MHVLGRSAKTDACGRSFAVFSTQASTFGLRLRHSRLACGSILEVSRDAVAAGEEQLVSCAAEQSQCCSICTVTLGPCGDLPSSQVSTLPIAKSQTRSKQNKDMHKRSSVYSERGVLLPVFDIGRRMGVSGHAKMPPASHQVSATPLKLSRAKVVGIVFAASLT